LSDTPPEIAPMAPHDLPEVLAIERASFATPWTEDNFRHEIDANPRAWNLVARVGGTVAGFVCAYVVEDELMINDVAVAAPFRRRGIARAMLAHLLDGASRRGCTRATLEVRPSNVAARDLYLAFGFVEIGRRPGYYSDTREDALFLCCSLPRPLTPEPRRERGSR
jgi:ribosomal-protein-alanine N-acetyltransferase